MILKKVWTALSFSICLLTLLSCGNRGLQDDNTVIALQPLHNYNKERIAFLKNEIGTFFGKRVLVLPDQKIPEAFVNYEKGKRYDAGSIIKWLRPFTNDTILTIAGLTHEDIFSTKRDKDGNIKKPESTYAIWGIFGLGYLKGKSCVIADKRLFTADEQKFRHRLRTVTIHEIGHNLGLPHCPNKGCIMSDANEKMATVDNSGDDYCSACNRAIGRTGNTLNYAK